MLEESVKAVRSAGEECFACERPIPKGEWVVQVSFKVPLLVTSATIMRQAHRPCCDRLITLLAVRLRDADVNARVVNA